MNYSGISYPVKPGRKGLFNIETDINLIKGNIIQILGTRKGERVMLPLFGSRILDFIHEPLDHITCVLLRFEIIDAISRWEINTLSEAVLEIVAMISEKREKQTGGI